jgi:hypothetical protein
MQSLSSLELSPGISRSVRRDRDVARLSRNCSGCGRLL